LLFWNLVLDHNHSPKELDTWALDELHVAHSIIEMRRDYKNAMKGREKEIKGREKK